MEKDKSSNWRLALCDIAGTVAAIFILFVIGPLLWVAETPKQAARRKGRLD